MNNNGAKTALVIGGGIAGLEAAKQIGQAGHNVILVEKESTLGGTLRQLHSSFPRWENPSQLLFTKMAELGNCPMVKVEYSTVVTSSIKQDSGFLVRLKRDKNVDKEVEVDAVIIATGFSLFDASAYGEYGYGTYTNVLNSLEFEAKLNAWAEGQNQQEIPKTIAFFKCVGSRDRSKGHPYCSKICCMYTAKQAGLAKDLLPDTKCYVFYMDYRASGKEYEEFVRSVIEQKHVRYVRGRPAKVLPEGDRLVIRSEDTLMGVPIEVRADMIVLASAIEPSPGTREMGRIFGLAGDGYGFLEPQYGRAAKAGERIFVAGACTFGVEIQGAIQQGAAAAAEVLALFNQDV
ncbi:MAG TPA: FAD-dependent oxidoreductase [Syntrophomonadaceae bacterium]|nr:FAD-dependent oxidoreductase [Syntrophomonadaceae bacterium]